MTSVPLAVLASLVPGLLWVWYFYRADRYDPEPKRLVYRIFVTGMVAVFLAALLETPVRPLLAAFPSLVGTFVIVLLGIGLVEEGVKLFVVYRGVYGRPEFDEVMDGIIYGTTAGLGFATLETFLYIFRFGIAVAPARALLTALAHASFSGLAGYQLGLAKFAPPGGAAAPPSVRAGDCHPLARAVRFPNPVPLGPLGCSVGGGLLLSFAGASHPPGPAAVAFPAGRRRRDRSVGKGRLGELLARLTLYARIGEGGKEPDVWTFQVGEHQEPQGEAGHPAR